MSDALCPGPEHLQGTRGSVHFFPDTSTRL